MTDTLMNISCEVSVNCTLLAQQPGATVVSPLVLSVTGVVGQVWALHYLHRRSKQQNRTVFYVMLSTLLWTDLIGKLTTTPAAILAYMSGHWLGGKEACNLHGFTMMTIGLVTHCMVSAMAVERYIGIRHGYYYSKNITTSRTRLLLLGIWLFGVLFCAMPLFGVGQYALQYPGTWCFVNIHVQRGLSPVQHVVYTNLYGALHLCSILVIAYCNFAVIGTLIRARMTRLREPLPGRCFQTRGNCRQRELEIQMVLVLVVITVVFLVSWLPLDLRIFLNQCWPHYTRADHYQDIVAVRLASVNQIIDPWAYIICRKLFFSNAWRKCLRLIQGRGWSKFNRDTSSLQVWVSPRRGSRSLLPGPGQAVTHAGPFSGRKRSPTTAIVINGRTAAIHQPSPDEERNGDMPSVIPLTPSPTTISIPMVPPNSREATSRSTVRSLQDGSSWADEAASNRDSGTESLRHDLPTSSCDDTSVFLDYLVAPPPTPIIPTGTCSGDSSSSSNSRYLQAAIPVFTSERYTFGTRRGVGEVEGVITRRLDTADLDQAWPVTGPQHQTRLDLFTSRSQSSVKCRGPVDRRQLLLMRQHGDRRMPRRLHSTYSADAYVSSRYSLTHTNSGNGSTSSGASSGVRGRRHSWCGGSSPPRSKHYRSQSTQTSSSSASDPNPRPQRPDARSAAVRSLRSVFGADVPCGDELSRPSRMSLQEPVWGTSLKSTGELELRRCHQVLKRKRYSHTVGGLGDCLNEIDDDSSRVLRARDGRQTEIGDTLTKEVAEKVKLNCGKCSGSALIKEASLRLIDLQNKRDCSVGISTNDLQKLSSDKCEDVIFFGPNLDPSNSLSIGFAEKPEGKQIESAVEIRRTNPQPLSLPFLSPRLKPLNKLLFAGISSPLKTSSSLKSRSNSPKSFPKHLTQFSEQNSKSLDELFSRQDEQELGKERLFRTSHNTPKASASASNDVLDQCGAEDCDLSEIVIPGDRFDFEQQKLLLDD